MSGAFLGGDLVAARALCRDSARTIVLRFDVQLGSILSVPIQYQSVPIHTRFACASVPLFTSVSRAEPAYFVISQVWIDNEEFVPHVIKATSKACESLCLWVRAIDNYTKVTKDLGPKKAKLADAEEKLSVATTKLEVPTSALSPQT